MSQENFTYNYQGLGKTFQDPNGNVTTYTYDYLGRLIKTVNPDGTARTVSYNDTGLVVSNYDENGHRVDYVNDPLQRLIGVREYYTTNSYYLSSYAYDGIGNLEKNVDAKTRS